MDYQTLKKNFEAHGFATHYCETGAEVQAYLEQQIQNTIVAFGGSATVHTLHLDEVLEKKNIVIWHHKVLGMDTMRAAQSAKVYICSANGVAETGELVNIDGTGNRVAMTIFGPEKVYYIVGKNKITPDLASAIDRAKNIAAPKNAQRLGRKTPCAAKGDHCYNCNSPERICRATVILDRPTNAVTAEIVFVNEDLGL